MVQLSDEFRGHVARIINVMKITSTTNDQDFRLSVEVKGQKAHIIDVVRKLPLLVNWLVYRMSAELRGQVS